MSYKLRNDSGESKTYTNAEGSVFIDTSSQIAAISQASIKILIDSNEFFDDLHSKDLVLVDPKGNDLPPGVANERITLSESHFRGNGLHASPIYVEMCEDGNAVIGDEIVSTREWTESNFYELNKDLVISENVTLQGAKVDISTGEYSVSSPNFSVATGGEVTGTAFNGSTADFSSWAKFGGKGTFGDTIVGPWVSNSNWAAFSQKNFEYAIMQSDVGKTYLNCDGSESISIRHGNTEKISLLSTKISILTDVDITGAMSTSEKIDCANDVHSRSTRVTGSLYTTGLTGKGLETSLVSNSYFQLLAYDRTESDRLALHFDASEIIMEHGGTKVAQTMSNGFRAKYAVEIWAQSNGAGLPNNSLFVDSSNSNKLSWKDDSGTITALI